DQPGVHGPVEHIEHARVTPAAAVARSEPGVVESRTDGRCSETIIYVQGEDRLHHGCFVRLDLDDLRLLTPLVSVGRYPAKPQAPTGLRCETLSDSVDQDLTLKLGDDAKDVADEAAHGVRGVKGLRRRLEEDLVLVESVHDLEKATQ